MPMQYPRRDHHHRSGRHLAAGEAIGSQRLPDDDEGRRVKPSPDPLLPIIPAYGRTKAAKWTAPS
jgi:hypothetical protein